MTPGRVVAHGGLVLVLALSVAAQLALFSGRPVTRAWGDERAYALRAHTAYDARSRPQELLPGGLELEWQPPLMNAVLSLVTSDAMRARYAQDRAPDPLSEVDAELQGFFARASVLNGAFLLAASAFLYVLGLQLGLTRAAATVATALFALHPRVLFFTQSLWPEQLHAALLLAHLVAFLAFLRGGAARHLVIASLLLVWCSLTKRLADHWFWIAGAILCVHQWRAGARGKRLAATLALFALPYLLLVGVQRTRNLVHDGAFQIATNQWINLEAGLTGLDRAMLRYKTVDDPLERERLSKERVLRYLDERSVTEIAGRQLTCARTVLVGLSFLQIARDDGRWGDRSTELSFLIPPAIALSWMLALGGAAALLCLGWTTTPRLATAALTGWLGLTMLIACCNPRFFVPAIPFLAVFTLLGVQAVARRVGRARA